MPKRPKKPKFRQQGYQIWQFLKMASVKTNKNKNLTPFLKTNFSGQETLYLGLKRFLHSIGPKNVICLWLRLGNIKQSWICIVYFCSKTKCLVLKSWSSEVVSDFCFCLFYWMPFYLNWIYKKDIGFGQSSKWKVVCLSKLHHISKTREYVFDFQYKVTIGECVLFCLHIL